MNYVDTKKVRQLILFCCFTHLRIPNETTESSSEYDDELSFLAESLSIQEQDSKRIKFMPYII